MAREPSSTGPDTDKQGKGIDKERPLFKTGIRKNQMHQEEDLVRARYKSVPVHPKSVSRLRSIASHTRIMKALVRIGMPGFESGWRARFLESMLVSAAFP